MPYFLSYEYGLISARADSAIVLQLASSEIACTLMRTVARDVIVYRLVHGTCVPEDACVVPALMSLQSWNCLVASRRLLRSQGRAGFLNVVLEHKSQTVDAPAPQQLLYVLLELRYFVTVTGQTLGVIRGACCSRSRGYELQRCLHSPVIFDLLVEPECRWFQVLTLLTFMHRAGSGFLSINQLDRTVQRQRRPCRSTDDYRGNIMGV